MEFSKATILAFFCMAAVNAQVQDPILVPLDCKKTVGIELVGSLDRATWLRMFLLEMIFTSSTQAGGGVICRCTTRIFDVNNLPRGVTWGGRDFNPEYVQNIAPGPDSSFIYASLRSTTLPTGVELGSTMPAPVFEDVTSASVNANIYNCSVEVNRVLGFLTASQVTIRSSTNSRMLVIS